MTDEYLGGQLADWQDYSMMIDAAYKEEGERTLFTYKQGSKQPKDSKPPYNAHPVLGIHVISQLSLTHG